jgi:hypothetical protein
MQQAALGPRALSLVVSCNHLLGGIVACLVVDLALRPVGTQVVDVLCYRVVHSNHVIDNLSVIIQAVVIRLWKPLREFIP